MPDSTKHNKVLLSITPTSTGSPSNFNITLNSVRAEMESASFQLDPKTEEISSEAPFVKSVREYSSVILVYNLLRTGEHMFTMSHMN